MDCKMNQTNTSKSKLKIPEMVIQGDRTPVPDAEYPARIINIEFGNYQNKRECIKFVFEIVTGSFTGIQLIGWVNAPPSRKVTKHTKLARWYENALGQNTGDLDRLNFESLIDRVVIVKTKTNISKWKNSFSNVEEILRLVTES